MKNFDSKFNILLVFGILMQVTVIGFLIFMTIKVAQYFGVL